MLCTCGEGGAGHVSTHPTTWSIRINAGSFHVLCCHAVFASIFLSEPFDELGNPLLDGRGGVVTQQPLRLANVGVRDRHVALLHADRINDGLVSHGSLDEPYEIREHDGPSVAQIDNLGLVGGDEEAVDDALDDVVHVREVSLGMAVVVHLYRLALADLVREYERGHVGSAVWTVHREEAEADLFGLN